MGIRLRPATDDDIPILYAFQADPVASEMAAFPSRDREAFEAHHRKVQADPTTRYAVVEADGVVVGWVGSWRGESAREVGYWFGRAHWGKGYATAAVRTFVEEVEETRPLFAYVAAQNIASQHVLRSAGFAEVARQQAPDVQEVVFRLDPG